MTTDLRVSKYLAFIISVGVVKPSALVGSSRNLFGELSNVSLAMGYEIAVYLAEWLVSMLFVSLNVEYEPFEDF